MTSKNPTGQRRLLLKAVAKALCDECYGEGVFDSFSASPQGGTQASVWIRQAIIAVEAYEEWESVSHDTWK